MRSLSLVPQRYATEAAAGIGRLLLAGCDQVAVYTTLTSSNRGGKDGKKDSDNFPGPLLNRIIRTMATRGAGNNGC